MRPAAGFICFLVDFFVVGGGGGGGGGGGYLANTKSGPFVDERFMKKWHSHTGERTSKSQERYLGDRHAFEHMRGRLFLV